MQAEVALDVFRCAEAYKKDHTFPIDQAAEWVGVLPIEALYYHRAIPVLCDLVEETTDVLTDDYTPDQLQELWLQARLRLYYPRTSDDQASFPAEAAELLGHPIQ